MKTRFIYIVLAISVVILVWLGSIYMEQNRLQMRYVQAVEHTYQVIIRLRNMEQLLVDAETSQRGYKLTHADRFKREFESARSKIDSAFASLKDIVLDNSKQRVYIKLLEPAIHTRKQILVENLETKTTEKNFVIKMERSKLVMDKIRSYIASMQQEEYLLLNYRDAEKTKYRDLSVSFLKYAFGFAGFVFLCSIVLIIIELRVRIKTQKMLEQSLFELTQSNEEIEQVSFAASHDLQEPLRKIRTLSTLLTKKYADSIPSEEKDIIERIAGSTERMHGLLENLIDFTNLVNQPEHTGPVNLDAVFMQVYTKLSADEEAVLIKHDALPVINGYEQQIALLFTQVLGNSFRFRDTTRNPEIMIQYNSSGTISKYKFWLRDKKYHVITISDNGIGFERSFKEKIFSLFQRLHSKDAYPGQGIGLTIARRIMTNHYGYIEADGKPGEGASITLYFPAG